MIGLLCFVLAVLAAPIKSKMRLEAENAVLRHQLTVLRRRLQGRVQLTNKDRRLLIVLYRWFPSILQVLTITECPLVQAACSLVEVPAPASHPGAQSGSVERLAEARVRRTEAELAPLLARLSPRSLWGRLVGRLVMPRPLRPAVLS
jgi:hypothetical protein